MTAVSDAGHTDGSPQGALCVVGSFMYDLVVSATRRPERGETLIGTSFQTYLGGKGFNQAVAASRAGARTRFIGRVGDDEFGHAFLDSLDEEGIDAIHVYRDSELGTGVGLPVVEPSGENSIIVVPRANLALTAGDVAAARSGIASSAVLLLQLEVPIDASLRAAQIAHEAGATVVLNPAPFAPLQPEFREVIDVLVPNETELRGLAGDASDDGDLLEVARSVQQQWRTTLVVTLGADGAVVLDAVTGDVTPVAGHPTKAVDTVGAGDVFCGYLGAQLADGASLVDAVDIANTAAALSVTRRGGGLSAPRRSELGAHVAVSAAGDGKHL